MNRIDVPAFCHMFYDCKNIKIHGWYIENGERVCKHRSYNDKFDINIEREFRSFEVIQFKVTKKGFIDIIATDF